MTTYLTFALVNSAFAVTLFISSYLFASEQRKLIRYGIVTTAKVIGYAHEENSSWITPQIQFEDHGKLVMTDANTAKIKKISDCPPGKIVTIKYFSKRLLGLNFYYAEILDEGLRPCSGFQVARVILYIGLVFVVITLIFLFMGLYEIL